MSHSNKAMSSTIAGDPIDKVLFPIAGIISIVLEMEDGDTAEVGIIGREGFNGLPLVLGGGKANQRTIIQVPDGGKCMSADAFLHGARARA